MLLMGQAGNSPGSPHSAKRTHQGKQGVGQLDGTARPMAGSHERGDRKGVERLVQCHGEERA